MFDGTSRPGSARLSGDHAEETDGLLSPLLPVTQAQLSAHCNVGAARDSPKSHAARLPACDLL